MDIRRLTHVIHFTDKDSAQDICDELQSGDDSWSYSVTDYNDKWLIRVFDEEGIFIGYWRG